MLRQAAATHGKKVAAAVAAAGSGASSSVQCQSAPLSAEALQQVSSPHPPPLLPGTPVIISAPLSADPMAGLCVSAERWTHEGPRGLLHAEP